MRTRGLEARGGLPFFRKLLAVGLIGPAVEITKTPAEFCAPSKKRPPTHPEQRVSGRKVELKSVRRRGDMRRRHEQERDSRF